jgi:hypothetical protein
MDNILFLTVLAMLRAGMMFVEEGVEHLSL